MVVCVASAYALILSHCYLLTGSPPCLLHILQPVCVPSVTAWALTQNPSVFPGCLKDSRLHLLGSTFNR